MWTLAFLQGRSYRRRDIARKSEDCARFLGDVTARYNALNNREVSRKGRQRAGEGQRAGGKTDKY